ncbi:MAG TPA: ABC-2 family transporter protein [Kofleriaceae bacterium]|jgi:ABC-2 type transport system permease protein
MMRYLRLASLQFRVSVAAAMAYRANFLVEGVMTLAWLALTLLPLVVLYSARTTVGEYDESAALVVMAYFIGVRAVLEGVIIPSLMELVQEIRSGAFDYVLLKPVDAQLLISSSRYELWKVFDLMGAIGLVVYAFWRRGTVPSVGNVAMGVGLFFAGVLAMYGLFIACAALAFWVVRLDNLMHLLEAVFDTARWPVQVFGGMWRIVFTFVIPVALMTTFPAMGLLGWLSLPAAAATVGGAIALLVVGRFVWRAALRSYTSASS